MVFQTIDNRQWRQQIAQRKVTITIVSGKTGSTDVVIGGELLNYIIVAPDLNDDATFALSLINEDSETTYTNAAIAENTSTIVLTSAAPIPLSGTVTFKCTTTTDQAASRSFILYLYYK